MNIDDIARRHGVSPSAARALHQAVQRGHGRMAQFDIAELGGMGQWSAGGMTQVGDMFNTALRDRVAALCAELADLPDDAPETAEPDRQPHAAWWPASYGEPASSGGQNDVHYAYFPAERRLAVRRGTEASFYDTGEHRIFGVAQSQGATQDLAFTSQLGPVRLADLRRVEAPR